jgi:hypothetical protein
VALTDDLRVTLHEPDLWVMDAADGAMTNLTDDGEDEVLAPAGSTPPQLDLLPVWRDDATILFARQHGRRAKSMVIASVPAAGGAVTVLAKIDATLSNLNAIAVQPGTAAIAYSVASHDMRSATVYLHRAEPGSDPGSELGNKPGTAPSTDRTGPAPSGKTAPPTTDDRVLLRATYDASLLSFSADGQYLLADNLLPRGMYTTMDDPKPQVVRVKDGTATPVAKGTPVWYPTWSPTGHALAFLPHRDGGVLQTVADPGGTPHPLADAAIAATPYQDLTWTPSELLVRAKKGVTVLTMDNE